MTIAFGTKVSLRRARLVERPRMHEWLINSDLSPNMLGGTLYPDRPSPPLVLFAEKFADHYFTGLRPYSGRSFIIEADGVDVGCVSHGPIDLVNDVTELDLWLAERRVAGRGLGSEALIVLADWLQARYGVNRFLIRPSRRNVKALRALRRAGFRETDLPASEVIEKLALPAGDYDDEILLFRILPSAPTPLIEPGHTYVFIDSEFTSLSAPQLISIGAVATDATAFYAELQGWEPERASDFVREVVMPLLDGDAVPLAMGADALGAWLEARAQSTATTIISDSGFDRWALAELFGREDLPPNVEWRRAPVAYEHLDEVTRQLGLRRHHALDDARALRYVVLGLDRMPAARLA